MTIPFSVLMSLYFKETPEHLEQCLLSLVNQTVPADEIVMVYDGEISPTLENIVEKYQEKLKINIIRLDTNQGLAKALNEGIKHCQYEWVFRMDTDDICDENRFAKQLAFIEKNPHLALFGGQIAEFNLNPQIILNYRKVPIQHQAIFNFAKWRSPFNHMTVAYKKSAVMKVNGYQSLQEDYNLWLKMIANGNQVANLDEVLVYARVGNGMLNRRRGWHYFKSEWDLFKLKYQLHFHGIIDGLFIFLCRAVPRLFPTSILNVIYRYLRQ